MLTFREFYQICEGKKPDTPPHAVPGTYRRDDDGTISYTLQKYEGPLGKPKKKEIEKLVVKRSGGKAVKQRLKKLAKSVKKIKEQRSAMNPNHLDRDLFEDLEQRRKQLMQRQREGITQFKERISSRVNASRKRLAKRREREQLKSEIKKELTIK